MDLCNFTRISHILLVLFVILRDASVEHGKLESNIIADRDTIASALTSSVLCYAQCMAKCEDIKGGLTPLPSDLHLDGKVGVYTPETYWIRCVELCGVYLTIDWIMTCNENPRCLQSCNYLNNDTDTDDQVAPTKPSSLIINQTSAYEIELRWTPVTTHSNHTVMYVVEEGENVQQHTAGQSTMSWSFVNKTTNVYMRIPIDDVCAVKHFHVAAVNQFGTQGFSSNAVRDVLPVPNHPQIIKEELEYFNYYFYYDMTYKAPIGWKTEDIARYVEPPLKGKLCENIAHAPVPLPPRETIVNSTLGIRRMTVRIFFLGYGCKYFSQMSAVSRCSVPGKPLDFTVDLTDCSTFPEFDCPVKPCVTPGNVERINTTIQFQNVTVTWYPPFNTGDMDRIEHYVMQWTPVKNTNPLRLLREESRIYVTVPESNNHLDPLSTTITVKQLNITYALRIVVWDNITNCNDDDLEKKLNSTDPQHIFRVPLPVESTIAPSEETTEDWSTSSPITHTSPWTSTTSKEDADTHQGMGFNEKLLYILLPLGLVIIVTIVIVTWQIYRKYYNKKDKKAAWSTSNETNFSSIFQKTGMQKFMIENPFYHKQTPSRLPETDEWEIPRSNLVLGEVLGQGSFGQVVLGTLKTSPAETKRISVSSTSSSTDSGETNVAVKLLLDYAEDSYRADFVKEIDLMKSIGPHPNIVSIIGCVTLGEPLCLVVEHVPHGDLLHYLRRQRNRITEGTIDYDDEEEYTPKRLFSFARQICVGMEFLSQRGFVHRDLATRNILVGEKNNVKIGDFGLTRYIYDDKIYVTRRGGKLPLKWMAIESIFDLSFSSQSDVWSFGVVLFELVTMGGTPYPTIANRDLLKELKAGYRMEQPDNCSQDMYRMMLDCWAERPIDRPTFTQLRNSIEAMIVATSSADYVTFDVDEEKDYYRFQCTDLTSSDDDVFASASHSCSHDGSISTCSSPPESRAGSTGSPPRSPHQPSSREGWHPNKFNRVEQSSPHQLSALALEEETPTVRVRQTPQEHLRVSTCSYDQLIPPAPESPKSSSSSPAPMTWF